jgi:MFS transporter, Spinster family, sphingosine-1-phosphate transporter
MSVQSASPASPSGITPGRASLLMGLLVLLNLFNYIDRYVLPPVFPAIEDAFGVTKAAQGTLATAFLLVYMLTAPVFGWMADRYSRWILVGIGMMIQVSGTLGSGLAPTFMWLLIFRCVMGVGDAAYGPAAPTIIADLYPIEKRGRMLAWFYAAIPVGAALGYAVGGGMRQLTGNWRMGFLVIIPPMLALAIVCLFIKDRHPSGSGDRRPRPTPADYRNLSRNKSYVLNCAGMTALTFAMGGMSYWMPSFLEEHHGIDPGRVGLTFGGILAATGLSATLAGGWAGDRLRVRVPGSYFLVSGTAMIVACPLSLAVAFVPMPWAWIIIGAALFCLFFNTGPSNTILANVTLPRVRASAFAINIFVIHTLGDAVSPPIIGYLKDIHSWELGFVLMAMVILLGGVLWLMGARFLARDTAVVEQTMTELEAQDLQVGTVSTRQ